MLTGEAPAENTLPMRPGALSPSSAGVWNMRQRVLEAVIFDIDGTLIDSVDLHAQSWVETF